MDSHIGFAPVQPKNGTVTIPAHLRRQFGLDKPGAQVEIVVRDSEIVLVPHVAIPAEDAWFWDPGHQAAEREVDECIAAGQVTTFDSTEAFAAHLHQLVQEANADDER